MVGRKLLKVKWGLPVAVGGLLLAIFFVGQPASAITPLPIPDPKPGSYGIGATKMQDPPSVGATITTPGNGASFTTSPIQVNGICADELLVQVYNNGVMVGSVMCENGSFSLEISLFAGVNELSADVFDSLDQTGPKSNVVTVTYTDTNFTAFGELITLTSAYGRRSAPTETPLTWPLQLSGGTGPYAFSIDWGDASGTELKSQSLAGLVAIEHTYKKAGIYRVNVRATDVNGATAFLQVIAVGSGQVETLPEPETKEKVVVQVLWIPAAIALALLGPAFWLGRRSQIISLQRKMLKEREQYKGK